ncbi:hypothetical protein CVU37_03875 [candidate division BRC1 bacterium HGW-BRC1-1]|jgi:AraC family transcriptional regulator of adaptative response/methylated-DNA-[protein]-cysteine methyltransferase|nr:MAG: hypothetical protein CVU37_03875 [candidate division BRC1 bacterium HGW-BRC1-1]
MNSPTINQIRYSFTTTTLGLLCVGQTSRGVCAVVFGDDQKLMLDDLAGRFAGAELIPGDCDNQAVAEQIARRVESPNGQCPSIPLDISGTAFQKAVWEILRQIPVGALTSYSEVANRLGRPTAVRAVAQACGANPISVLIPCHRVVAKNAALTGYRWGLERKSSLLQREQEAVGGKV